MSCSPRPPSIFQNLANEHADPLVRLNLEALREAAGLDALLIATFDSRRTR